MKCLTRALVINVNDIPIGAILIRRFRKCQLSWIHLAEFNNRHVARCATNEINYIIFILIVHPVVALYPPALWQVSEQLDPRRFIIDLGSYT